MFGTIEIKCQARETDKDLKADCKIRILLLAAANDGSRNHLIKILVSLR
jgi:hypothetical protein